MGPARPPAGPSYSSKPTSPATNNLSAFNSPRIGDQFTPMSASPRFAAMQRDPLYETPLASSARDPRGPTDGSLPFHPSAYNMDALHHAASTTTSAYSPYGAHYQATAENSARRPTREVTRLPPLSHEDTTLSSESSHSNHSLPLAQLAGQAVPLDSIKTMRTLPQPVQSIGSSQSLLDRPQPSAATPMAQHSNQSHAYHRTQGPLAVLIRAGELAGRLGDDNPMEEGSP
jgi:hypothetical protein